MRENELTRIAEQLMSGELSKSAFVQIMKADPFKDLGEVKLDTHRTLRKGFPEIIYCPGKSIEQMTSIGEEAAGSNNAVLFSRISREQFELLIKIIPELVYYPAAGMAGIRPEEKGTYKGVIVATGGSSDVPVAEEAALTAEHMSCEVQRIFDVGVAGVHRLLAHVEILQSAKVIIAVAGMEGALPAVISGLVQCPVIGVPTDVGYGANLGGIAPLLTMVNSCAPGVSVVNINNGLGAGYTGALIARQSAPHE